MQTIYVSTQAELEALVPKLAALPFIAVDTEFVRVDTFHAKLGLIQIGDREHEYLIDPIAVGDVSALKSLLLSEMPRKVLHACSEDIEVLTRLAGSQPRGIFDTQIAAAFLGQGLQIGYQKALQVFLNVDIPKDESRSDWMARPLTESQIEYAALDVRYLPALYDKLIEELEAKGLTQWVEADCALMMTELAQAQIIDPERIYEDVSNAWRLFPNELAILKALTKWREEQARKRDMPRGFLIKNASLFNLARKQPQRLSQLAEIEDVTPRILRREGESILKVIAEAKTIAESAWPQRLPTPLPKEAKKVFDALKQEGERVAQEINVPLEVLLRKKHVEGLVMGFVDFGDKASLPLALTGWRFDKLTPRLLAVLKQFESDLAAWGQIRRDVTEGVRS